MSEPVSVQERAEQRLRDLANEGQAHLDSWSSDHPNGPDLECPACDDIFGQADLLRALTRELEQAKIRAYRQARIWEPNMDAYNAAMTVYAAAFGNPDGEPSIVLPDGSTRQPHEFTAESRLSSLLQAIQGLEQQARCEHKDRTGGNDYQLCNICEFDWDYRRETAQEAFRRTLAHRLQQLREAHK